METCQHTEQLGNTIFQCIMEPHGNTGHWMVANVVIDELVREQPHYNPFAISMARYMIELSGYLILIAFMLILTMAVFNPEALPGK